MRISRSRKSVFPVLINVMFNVLTSGLLIFIFFGLAESYSEEYRSSTSRYWEKAIGEE